MQEDDFNILIIAATPFEVQPLIDHLQKENEPLEGLSFPIEGGALDILISGSGMALTSLALSNALYAKKYNLVINAGIAGSYNKDVQLGAVVNVVSECFGDIGIEEADGGFTDLFKADLLEKDQFPFTNGTLHNDKAHESNFLPKVHGVTIAMTSGSQVTVDQRKRLYPLADVESMEGAVVFLHCLTQQVPFLEIRSISNYVEVRNRNNWDIGLAITKLNEVLVEMVMGF